MTEIYKRIIIALSTLTEIKNIQVWNNQIDNLENGTIDSMQLPALFIEIQNGFEIQDLLMGVQFFDNLIVRVHLLHEYYNDPEYQSHNFEVFNVMQHLYLSMHNKQLEDMTPFVRINQEQDFDHNNLYHGMIDFRTTYMDYSHCTPFDYANLKTSEKEITLPITTNRGTHGLNIYNPEIEII